MASALRKIHCKGIFVLLGASLALYQKYWVAVQHRESMAPYKIFA